MIKLLLLLTLSGMFNACMDILKYHYASSIFGKLGKRYPRIQKWAGPKSHLNKYKNRDRLQGPAFPGSTTIFVFITDAWHTFQMLWRTCFTLGLQSTIPIHWEWLPPWIGNFIVYSIIYLLTFNVFYEKLLRSK